MLRSQHGHLNNWPALINPNESLARQDGREILTGDKDSVSVVAGDFCIFF